MTKRSKVQQINASSEYAWMTPPERKLRMAVDCADAEFKQESKGGLANRARAAKQHERLRLNLAKPLLVRDSLSEKHCMEISTTTSGIWQDLVRARSPAFAKLLRELLKSRNHIVASEAAMHLAWIGFDKDIRSLLTLMRTGSTSLTANILKGAHLAALHKHSSPRAHAAFFRALLPLLRGERFVGRTAVDRAVRESAVEAAEVLDPAAAKALFRSSECLHPKNPIVREVLWRFEHALTDSRRIRPLAPELLWPVFDAVRSGKLRVGGDYEEQVLGLILLLAADDDPIRTLREARAVIKATNPKQWNQYREFAERAIKRCGNGVEPSAALAALQRRPKCFSFEAIKVLRVQELAEHVVCDGFSLYFENYPEHAPATLAGLKKLQLTKAAALFQRAARIFGPSILTASSRVARRAFENLDDAAQARLDRLDQEFDKLNGTLFSAVERFVGNHPGLFAAKKPMRGKTAR